MIPQGFPLWAAWETYYGPVVGWQADTNGGRWWPVVAQLEAPDTEEGGPSATVVPYARLFDTVAEARTWSLSTAVALHEAVSR